MVDGPGRGHRSQWSTSGVLVRVTDGPTCIRYCFGQNKYRVHGLGALRGHFVCELFLLAGRTALKYEMFGDYSGLYGSETKIVEIRASHHTRP